MKIRKNIIFLVTLVIGIVLLSGYYSLSYFKGEDMSETEIIYKRLDSDNLPAEIKNWIENSRETFSSQSRVFEGKTYVLVTLGRKPTAGYSIVIDEVFKEDGKIVISVLSESPSQDSMVAQVITFPYDIIVIDFEVGEIEYRYK